MAFRIMTLSVLTLSVFKNSHHNDIQYKDTQHYEIQFNDAQHMNAIEH